MQNSIFRLSHSELWYWRLCSLSLDRIRKSFHHFDFVPKLPGHHRYRDHRREITPSRSIQCILHTRLSWYRISSMLHLFINTHLTEIFHPSTKNYNCHYHETHCSQSLNLYQRTSWLGLWYLFKKQKLVTQEGSQDFELNLICTIWSSNWCQQHTLIMWSK